MESYGTWENLQQAFAEFGNKVPFYGAVVACTDAPVLPRLTRRVITYALSDRPADITGLGMRLEAFGASCDVLHRPAGGATTELGPVRDPGRHNLLNAPRSLETGIPFARIAAALAEFQGAERRFQMRGEEKGVMVVDDYGHHPTENRGGDCRGARRHQSPRRRRVQPHRYSRTSQLMREFGLALGAADEVVLTDLAGEAPDTLRVTIERLADAVRAVAQCPVHVVKALDALPAAVSALARSGESRRHARRQVDRRVGTASWRRFAPAPPPQKVGDERQGASREKLPPGPGEASQAEGTPRWLSWRVARALGCAVVVIYTGYRAIDLAASTSMLQVRRIAVRGNVRLSAGEVQALVDGLRGTVPTADLAAYRRRLLDSPWVADVALRRVLPSTVEVFVSERRPIGLCRLGNQVSLVDGRAW